MSRYDYDLIVLGTGAAGSVAAHIAVSSGKKVAIVEKSTFGGECPNWGDVPLQSLLHAANLYYQAKEAQRFGIRTATLGYNYPTIKAWKDLAVQRTGTARGKATFEAAGINVLRGAAQFASPHEIIIGRRYYSAAHFLIATGATPYIPPIEGLDDTTHLTPHTAIDILKPPKSLFIIGGGSTGLEFAQLFAPFGTKLTIAEARPRLLPREDKELGELLASQFQRMGVNILTTTKVTKIAQEGLQKRVYFRQGTAEASLKVDEILLAAGNRPAIPEGINQADIQHTAQGITVDDYMQTTSPHIFAAGDVLGQDQFTHAAIYQSRVAAHNMWHRQKITANTQVIPRTVSTCPAVAAVGLTENEATKYAIAYRTATAPLSLIGRSNVSDHHLGFVKILASPEGNLLGASIAAPHAGELIHELALAIQLGAATSDVAGMVHAYPTWSEAIRIACSKLT